jgi:hypothetical protein
MNIYLYPNYKSIDQELQEKEEGKKYQPAMRNSCTETPSALEREKALGNSSDKIEWSQLSFQKSVELPSNTLTVRKMV